MASTRPESSTLAYEEATRALAARLERTAFVELREHREPWRWLGAIETRNRYVVSNLHGATLGWAAEEGDGLRRFPSVQRVGSLRPFDVILFDEAHRLAFHAAHAARWLRARLDVDGGDGHVLGAVQQRFSITRKVVEVLDADGRAVLTARSRPYPARRFDFDDGDRAVAAVEDRTAALQAGRIRSQFAVTFDTSLRGRERLLVVAASLLVRAKYF